MEFRSQPLRKSARFALRRRITVLAVIGVFSVILLRVGWLTVVRGEELRERADRNLQTRQRIEAPRGNILDRNNLPVALNRRAYAVTYARRGRSSAQVHETLQRLGELLGEEYLTRKDEIMETRPSWTRHRLARGLTQEQIVPLLERPEDFPGIDVEEDFRREYPSGPALASVVGYLGKIPPEDVETYTRPTYLPDAWIGRTGLERQYEARLVGEPGVRRLVRDARGRAIETPEVERRAEAGEDLVLTIDARLQEQAYRLLGGQTGSLLLMDAITGEVLVLASTPAFDPASPGRSEIDGRPVSWINRAVRGRYPPGSTFKLVTAVASLTHGLSPQDTHYCRGWVEWPGWGHRFHCDHRSGHGTLDLPQSITKSCNVYFYEEGHRLGGSVLAQTARAMGFGEKTGIDLPGEAAGSLGRSEVPSGGEVLNFSIGQGQLLATPLQVAVSFAALANGGDLVTPHLVREFRDAAGAVTETVVMAPRRRIRLTAAQRAALVKGFDEAVNSPSGTAYKAGFPREWQVAGKTGTAENGQGGVDAWFACFLPVTAPRYVAVAHVEQADGHGGDVAAPLVRELITELYGPLPETEPPLQAAAAGN